MLQRKLLLRSAKPARALFCMAPGRAFITTSSTASGQWVPSHARTSRLYSHTPISLSPAPGCASSYSSAFSSSFAIATARLHGASTPPPSPGPRWFSSSEQRHDTLEEYLSGLPQDVREEVQDAIRKQDSVDALKRVRAAAEGCTNEEELVSVCHAASDFALWYHTSIIMVQWVNIRKEVGDRSPHHSLFLESEAFERMVWRLHRVWQTDRRPSEEEASSMDLPELTATLRMKQQREIAPMISWLKRVAGTIQRIGPYQDAADPTHRSAGWRSSLAALAEMVSDKVVVRYRDGGRVVQGNTQREFMYLHQLVMTHLRLRLRCDDLHKVVVARIEEEGGSAIDAAQQDPGGRGSVAGVFASLLTGPGDRVEFAESTTLGQYVLQMTGGQAEQAPTTNSNKKKCTNGERVYGNTLRFSSLADTLTFFNSFPREEVTPRVAFLALKSIAHNQPDAPTPDRTQENIDVGHLIHHTLIPVLAAAGEGGLLSMKVGDSAGSSAHVACAILTMMRRCDVETSYNDVLALRRTLYALPGLQDGVDAYFVSSILADVAAFGYDAQVCEPVFAAVMADVDSWSARFMDEDNSVPNNIWALCALAKAGQFTATHAQKDVLQSAILLHLKSVNKSAPFQGVTKPAQLKREYRSRIKVAAVYLSTAEQLGFNSPDVMAACAAHVTPVLTKFLGKKKRAPRTSQRCV
jgi:hypothetical protein